MTTSKQIKLFNGEREESLQASVNEWITENDIEVTDIKFADNITADGGYGIMRVMVVYEIERVPPGLEGLH